MAHKSLALLLCCFLNTAYAQQVPQVAVVPGSNNAYAAGFSGNRSIAPAFPTTVQGPWQGYDLYDRSNPNVLVGPMPGVGALLSPVTPFLNESFYHGGSQR
jgi:hypothetical protein